MLLLSVVKLIETFNPIAIYEIPMHAQTPMKSEAWVFHMTAEKQITYI